MVSVARRPAPSATAAATPTQCGTEACTVCRLSLASRHRVRPLARAAVLGGGGGEGDSLRARWRRLAPIPPLRRSHPKQHARGGELRVEVGRVVEAGAEHARVVVAAGRVGQRLRGRRGAREAKAAVVGCPRAAGGWRVARHVVAKLRLTPWRFARVLRTVVLLRIVHTCVIRGVCTG